jgi:cardiolipin synthase
MESPPSAAAPVTTPAADYRDPPPFAIRAQGQDLEFFPGGRDRLERLCRLIDEAQTSLRMAFYIFTPDAVGVRVRDALVAAARRGVHVTVIVDGFGAEVHEEFFAELEDAGGHFYRFLPRWSVRFLIRNHQKIVIADERVVMLGGFNVEEDYFTEAADNGWNDLGFTVEGSLVDRVVEWFAELEEWTRNPVARFRDIRRRVREWKGGNAPVQLLIGGPTRWLSPWAKSVTRDLISGERLDMVMAYFSPAVLILRRIRRIARKGQTRLVLAAKSDNAATIGASRLLYTSLLKARARIFEFEPCRLHTKLIVLDDAVYVGSANFDMRSLYINLEIVVKIEDAALAARMRQYIDHMQEASTPITPALHKSRATRFNRLRWWVSWVLVSVVDYTVSRRLNLGL